MSKLTKDQKRAKKLKAKKKQCLSSQNPDMAYEGNKFRTPYLIPVFHKIESIIFDFATKDTSIDDRHIRKAVTNLVHEYRGNKSSGQPSENIDSLKEAVAEEVHTNFSGIGRSQIVGVLRSILGSLNVYESSDNRGYLDFLEEFLQRFSQPQVGHVHNEFCNH